MAHTTLRLYHFDEFQESVLQIGELHLRIEQSNRPVVRNEKHPKAGEKENQVSRASPRGRPFFRALACFPTQLSLGELRDVTRSVISFIRL